MKSDMILNNCNTFHYSKMVVKIFLYYSGLSFLFVKLLYFIAYYFYDKPGTMILCYHSINDTDSTMIYNPNIVETNLFIKQIMYLKRNYNVVSLDYFVNNYKKLTSGKNVVITFDDGYKDNFTNAYPVLKKYKVPATYFLATDYIDTGKSKLEDLLTYSFYVRNITAVEISSLNLTQKIRDDDDRNQVIRSICYSLSNADEDMRQDIIRELTQKYLVESDNTNNLMMTWSQLRQMDRQLISFGSHSAAHCNLTSLSHENLVKDIRNSKAVLEEQFSCEVSSFSYPLGFFDSSIIQAIKAAGFKNGLTIVPGINSKNVDLFRLKRVMPANNYQLFKFRLICQSGMLHDIYQKLICFLEHYGKRLIIRNATT
jgi:peptidoglycan/xylan/chitin deacetylase (PgdA/CDA1 family)